MSAAVEYDYDEDELARQYRSEFRLFQNRPSGKTLRVIAKARTCDRCGCECHAGETMEYTVGLADGGFFYTYECFICVERSR